jgi:hypothetical protein
MAEDDRARRGVRVRDAEGLQNALEHIGFELASAVGHHVSRRSVTAPGHGH